MTFATDMQDTAKELIEEFGNAATYKGGLTNGYDPTTGAVTPDTSGVSFTMAGPFGISPQLVDGSLVQSNDAKALIASKGSTFTPEVGKTIVSKGCDWTITHVMPVCTQDTTVIWEVRIR